MGDILAAVLIWIVAQLVICFVIIKYVQAKRWENTFFFSAIFGLAALLFAVVLVSGN